MGLRMKRDFGMLVSRKKNVKGLWKSCFERLMNGEEGLVTSMGIENRVREVTTTIRFFFCVEN